MKYLVDTSICISFLDQDDGWQNVEQRILSCNRGDIAISALSAVEFGMSVVVVQYRKANRAQLRELMRLWRVLPFDDRAATAAIDLRLVLRRLGRQIGTMDELIAAHALSLGLVCVTKNQRHFDRVPGLRVENWLDPLP